LTACDNLIFGQYKVTIDGSKLEGEAWGEPVSVESHAPAVEIKGATLSELKVEK
jgi:SHS2 domain-containing protein